MTPDIDQITALGVEQQITDAGRAEVFARARALGWSAANSPPLWVWAEIARETAAAKRDRAKLSQGEA